MNGRGFSTWYTGPLPCPIGRGISSNRFCLGQEGAENSPIDLLIEDYSRIQGALGM